MATATLASPVETVVVGGAAVVVADTVVVVTFLKVFGPSKGLSPEELQHGCTVRRGSRRLQTSLELLLLSSASLFNYVNEVLVSFSPDDDGIGEVAPLVTEITVSGGRSVLRVDADQEYEQQKQQRVRHTLDHTRGEQMSHKLIPLSSFGSRPSKKNQQRGERRNK